LTNSPEWLFWEILVITDILCDGIFGLTDSTNHFKRINFLAKMSKTGFRHYSHGRLRHREKRRYFNVVEAAEAAPTAGFSKMPRLLDELAKNMHVNPRKIAHL
jgi:hypothetical protein